MPTYNLDPTMFPPIQIGALLMAIVAWPEAEEMEGLGLVAEAIAADTLRKAYGVLPSDEADLWKADFPGLAAIDRREIKRCLRTFKRRYRDRMVAARMALGFIEEGLTGKPVRLPPSMRRHSLNQLSALVKSDLPLDDPEMIERRIWRASRPVVHIAVALQVWARMQGLDAKDIPYPLDDGDLHSAIIALAEAYEPVVLGDRRFGVREENIVRLRQSGLRAAA
jgi:hypothetical protein